MSIPLLLWLVSTELLLLDLVHCAPKIGGIMFEPILFEAFESDETTTIPTEIETTLSELTVNSTLLYPTGSTKETVAQVDTLRSEVEMENPEEVTIATSTSTAEETTTFISELNFETASTPINTSNTTLTSTNYSADQNTTFSNMETTKKVMLYELVSPDKLKKYGRARDESTTANVILNFLGYNFDDTICRIVDDRVLCGYNSNPQLVQPVQTIEVGNDCRLRGDRIECGYVNPPFDGMRRPAVKPGGNNRRFSKDPLYDRVTKTTTKTKPTTITSSKGDEKKEEQIKLVTQTNATTRITTTEATSPSPSTTTVSPSTTTATTTERTTIEHREHCVEKDDRIVCYDVRN